MKRATTLILLVALSAQPLEAQSRLPRKWLMAGVGGLVTGVISLAFTAGNPNTDIGGCNSKQCVIPVTIGAGLLLGFMIGSEMDHLYNLRYAHAPPIDLPGASEMPLTLVANDLTVRPRTILVAGEGGVEVVHTNQTMEQLGVRARGLRGIGSVTADSGTNSLLVGTGVGLYRFPLTGDEAGTLAHAGEISAASADGQRVAVGLGTAFQIAALGDSLTFFGDPIEEGSRVVDVQWSRPDLLWVLTEDRLGAYKIDTAGVATLLGADSLPATGRRLAIQDSIAVIAAGAGGVFAVSLSDPSAPKTLANWSGARFAYDATMVHGMTYVAGGPEGLYVLRLGAEGFTAAGLSRDAGFVAAVKTDGQALYLIDRTGGLLRRIPVLAR